LPSETRHLATVERLVTGFGKKQVLNSVDLHVSAGEIVAVIGHNGAGKSTLLKAMVGMLPIWAGRVTYDAIPIGRPDPRRLRSMGVAYVPQGNRVFNELSVRENLVMGGFVLADRSQLNLAIERVCGLFPELRPRLAQRAGTLSGGEKQMLALASGLVVSPRLLLLDEPSLGLAPSLAASTLQMIERISRHSGCGLLIVEQKVRDVLQISDRVYVMRNGVVSFSGSAAELRSDTQKLREVFL